MDSELVGDLEEALEGVDPVEFLLADPDLKGVAEEIWSLSSCLDSDDRFEEATASELAVDCEEKKRLYPEESSSGISSGNVTSPGTPSGSPWSDLQGQAQPMAATLRNEVYLPRKDRVRKNNRAGALCVACDRPAKGCKYYGVVVCNSCRAFFARAIKDNTYKNFLCVNGDAENMCHIDSQSWMACQKCRYDKCLEVGMAVSNSKSSKNGHGTKTSGESMSLERHSAAVAAGRPSGQHFSNGYGNILALKVKRLVEPADTLTAEEKLAIENITSKQIGLHYISFANLIRTNMDIFKASMEFFYEGKSYPLQMHKMVEDYMLYHTTKNRSALQEFPWNKLKPNDVQKLVAHNFPLAGEYVHAYNMNKTSGIKEEVKSYYQTLMIESDDDLKKEIKRIYSKVRY